MVTHQWFRFYHVTMQDKKIRSLVPSHRWLWAAVLTAASESPIRGLLLITCDEPVKERHLADLANLPVAQVRKALPLFCARELISWNTEMRCWQVERWDDRQFESDTSTERTRKHREMVKRSRSVPGNASGTDTESREQSTDLTKDSQQQELATRVPVDNPAAAALLAGAFEVIYQRRPPARRNPKRHHDVLIAAFPADFADEISRVDWSLTWTAESLADWLEPVQRPHVKPHPVEQTRSTVAWFPGCEPSLEEGA